VCVLTGVKGVALSISLTQAAELLGVSRQRVHQMIQRGDFETVERFGGMLMLSRDEVEKVITYRASVAAEMAKSGSTIIAAQQVVMKREERARRKGNRARVIEVGVVQAVKERRLAALASTDDPYAQLCSWWGRTSEAERRRFRAYMEEPYGVSPR